MAEEYREAKDQPEAVIDYLNEKGWHYKDDRKGENFRVMECPFCQNQNYNFEIHKSKGMFLCWACDEKGGFYKLKEHMGDVTKVSNYSDAGKKKTRTKKEKDYSNIEAPEGLTDQVEKIAAKIWERPVPLAYLRQRGFTDDSIIHFKLGSVKQNGKRWITIPHYEKGKAVNLKYRAVPPDDGGKRWKSHPSGRKVLYNGDITATEKEIIIVEGELKAIALWQMGFKNVVGLTSGVGNFYSHWVDQVEHCEKIYLCLDSDKEGQQQAEVLANRLGLDRCYNIKLEDAKDPDEYFFQQGHSAQDFRDEMKHARQWDVKNLMGVVDALEAYRLQLTGEDNAPEAIMSPWPEVNRLTKGFRPGEMIILSAPPKIGKTTWALDLTYDLVMREQGVLFYCMEMGPARLAQKLVSRDNHLEEIFIDETIVCETQMNLMGKPLYIPERVKGSEVQDIVETMRQAYKRYGIKMIVFDNLHFLVRDADKQREKLGMASQAFKLLAEELRIPIIVIVHPRKLKKQDRAMTSADLRDTSAIHADADMVIVLHRNRVSDDDPDMMDDDGPEQSIFEPETEIIVDAARYAPGGKTKLYYEGGQSRFRRLDRSYDVAEENVLDSGGGDGAIDG